MHGCHRTDAKLFEHYKPRRTLGNRRQISRGPSKNWKNSKLVCRLWHVNFVQKLMTMQQTISARSQTLTCAMTLMISRVCIYSASMDLLANIIPVCHRYPKSGETEYCGIEGFNPRAYRKWRKDTEWLGSGGYDRGFTKNYR